MRGVVTPVRLERFYAIGPKCVRSSRDYESVGNIYETEPGWPYRGNVEALLSPPESPRNGKSALFKFVEKHWKKLR
jgi:hypothetical protein